MRKDDVDESNTASGSSQEERNPFITLDLSDFPARYRDVCPIGCGSRGLIFSALDQRSLRRLAVKKLTVKQDNKEQFLKQVLREIRILHRLEHQNITKIYHVLVSTGGVSSVSQSKSSSPIDQFQVPNIDSLYIGMELMDTDLRNVLAKSTLSPEYVKLFMYQLLRGVKYIHSANVMHRDLNPSNVFINMDTLMLKIGDFGVSRIYDSEYDHTHHLSMPLTTKYYQAPELILHPQHYTMAIDIWAIGCIFIEMYHRTPVFAGDHALDQMNAIMETIPVREEDWLSVVNSGCADTNCCASPLDFPLHDNDGCPKKPLEKLFPKVERAAINLLKQILCFDPQLRIPSEDALNHPFFVSYSTPFDEPNCSRPFRIEDELEDYSTADLESMLQSETYSGTSSFSNSVDAANISHVSNLQTLEENLLRVNSGSNLLTNSSYRHLLSLADNSTQQEVVSESEVRSMACDFEYGVQIHECSFNKDRMSMDFRPILSDAGFFDPYKWNSSSGPPNMLKKENQSSSLRASRGSEPNQKDLSRFDTGYNSSYCSSSMTSHSHTVNQFSHPNSSTLWSFSSPEVSSDHENHGCATPDSISSPPFNLDSGSAANSPVLEETATETLTSNRHSDVGLVHHTSSRHHHSHHHHHHPHHHHRHHKHKKSHRDSVSTLKNGDGSHENLDKKARSHDNSCSASSKRSGSGKKKSKSSIANDEGATSNKNVVFVTGPDGDVLSIPGSSGGDEENEESTIEETITHLPETTSPKEKENEEHTINKFDKQEVVHEHSLTESYRAVIHDHASSAFTKYVSDKSDSADLRSEPVSSGHAPFPLSFFAPDLGAEDARDDGSQVEEGFNCTLTDNNPQAVLNMSLPGNDSKPEMKPTTITKSLTSEALAEIKSLWQKDISILALKTASPRPRTWSEGSGVHGQRHEDSFSLSKTTQGRTLVQKLYSQFTQIFSESSLPFKTSCCLTSQDSQNQSECTPPYRMRHFSDDRRYVLSPQLLLLEESFKGTSCK